MRTEKVPSKFPRSADKLVQFFDWEIDELMPIAFGSVFGIALKNVLLIAMGFPLMKLYIYLKRRYPNNFIFIFLYQSGFINVKDKLPGYVRIFQE